MGRAFLILLVVAGLLGFWLGRSLPVAGPAGTPDYLRLVYSPLHFKPAIETARDADCLACHGEVLEDRVRARSPSGRDSRTARAWYQQLSTYQGEQDTFHRRHLVTSLARQLMRLSCNTCHQGHDPRDQAPGTSATGPAQGDAAFTLRKGVNPETICLKCHGQMNWPVMGLPAAWPESKRKFNDDCLGCHATIRTRRHQVSYLKPDAIEAAAKGKGDLCFGCHGGRAWYRLNYPYPRHAWPGMPEKTPAWASGRPTESEARFRLPEPSEKK
ncbi:MAG: hypothetical protein PHU46_00890 [Rhodocyclaceae bacterium]|nr:hypothetical protein [Rhodocyclaceae bacterium]